MDRFGGGFSSAPGHPRRGSFEHTPGHRAIPATHGIVGYSCHGVGDNNRWNVSVQSTVSGRRGRLPARIMGRGSIYNIQQFYGECKGKEGEIDVGVVPLRGLRAAILTTGCMSS